MLASETVYSRSPEAHYQVHKHHTNLHQSLANLSLGRTYEAGYAPMVCMGTCSHSATCSKPERVAVVGVKVRETGRGIEREKGEFTVSVVNHRRVRAQGCPSVHHESRGNFC